MKKITGLLMVMTLFFASCNTPTESENKTENETTTTTSEEGMKVDDGNSYKENIVKKDFRPIDVYIFIDGDETKPIENARISVSSEGEDDQSGVTNRLGISSFTLTIDKQYKFTIEAERYRTLVTTVPGREGLKFGLVPIKK